jgi:hypothetical protein
MTTCNLSSLRKNTVRAQDYQTVFARRMTSRQCSRSGLQDHSLVIKELVDVFVWAQRARASQIFEGLSRYQEAALYTVGRNPKSHRIALRHRIADQMKDFAHAHRAPSVQTVGLQSVTSALGRSYLDSETE